jgi:tryptophan-rich sensory protein
MPADAATLRAPTRSTGRLALAWGAALVLVALLGGLGSDTDSDWYRGLDLPAFQPSGSVFAPVWTVLYVLIAISATLATRDAPRPLRGRIIGLFALNLVLNVAWTWIFFKAHAPVLAGIEIGVLLATILALIWLVRPVNGLAAALLVPYTASVLFATALTWTIAATN